MEEEKKDYGKTLNLPKTEFPMRGNLPQREPEFQEKVLDNGLYEKILKKNEGHESFVLHDGPPYANGEIHIGHALNKVLKDTIVRYKALKGYYTPYVPGYDTHGMPTEKKAIEKLGLDRDKIPISKFRDTCKEFTSTYKDKQTEGFKRLGCIGDWEHPYITYDPALESRQLGVFWDMYKKGYMYKGLKPVYWCTDCETALAEAEIEYQDVDTMSIFVKFPVRVSKGLFETENTYFVIWTTTPWTLPGNVGITIGGEFEYSLVEVGNEKLLMAKALVDDVMGKIGVTEYKILETYMGTELEGILCKHPFLDRDSRVVLGSDDTIVVELGTGTGAVHTAPGYGKEDYLCGLKNGLDIVVCVDGKGFQTKDAGIFAGLRYDKSNDAIINWLEENNFLLYKQKINHAYPHCWRCKNPIIFRATEQWFCSVDKFRDQAIAEANKVDWIPKWGAERITTMISERADWCISRQRTWGVPIPIFYCKDCGKEYITEESIEKIKKIFKEKGSNAWWDLTEKELMPEGAKCECGCMEFKKESDIMDVWFDSGSTHQSVLVERGLPYPADLYLEGADQYRGWFQSSLLTSVATNGIAPFKQVLTHGWTVDGEGKKMSKSLGNGISPQDVIKEYGADILRLWVLSSDYQSDVSLSKNILVQITEVYRKLRNTARYILGNIFDFDPNKDMVVYDDLEEIDKYALLKLNDLVKKVTQSYDRYDFHEAYQAINVFCVTDMSSFYLDILKDRLYSTVPNSKERRAAQTTMYLVLNTLEKLLAPMTCFTAEEIWSFMPKLDSENVESVMLTSYPTENSKYEDEALREKWQKIVDIKEVVAKKLEEARANKVIGHSLNAKVTLYADEENYKFIEENLKLLQSVFIISLLDVQKNVRLGEEKLGVKVEVAPGEKCERCWMYSETVGENHDHPTLCHRCAEVMKEI